jgi:hypothetical protein
VAWDWKIWPSLNPTRPPTLLIAALLTAPVA